MVLPISATQGLASFADTNGDAIYEPDAGDFPVLDIRGCYQPLPIPDELFWFVYHDISAHDESQMTSLNVEVQCQIFAFNCDENTPNGNTIYTSHKIINHSKERLSDTYVGLFTDFNIGNKEDDFFGCDPDRSLTFAYNGDDNDEGGYGTESPVMAVDVLRTPFDEDLTFVDLKAVLPIESMTLNEPYNYYNLLKGLHSDGSTLPNNGLFYTDNPSDSNGWSEITEENIPGDRKVLTSYGPFPFPVASGHEFIVAYTFHQEPGNDRIENINMMYDQSDQIQSFFDNCFNNNNNAACNISTSTQNEPLITSRVKVFPNPTQGEFNIQSDEFGIKKVELFDVSGRIVLKKEWTNSISNPSLSIQHLPKGLYFLQLDLENNEQVFKKIVMQ